MNAPYYTPRNFGDRFAYAFVSFLRFSADLFFAKHYGHRAIALETVAAVPGMVGATLTHLRCLRRIDAGVHANVPAPEIAKNYWKLPANATLRDGGAGRARRRGGPP